MVGLVKAPFIPSPKEVVREAIEFSRVSPSDVFYDLGAGDGRVVFEAAKRGAYCVAVEINPYLVEVIREKARVLGLNDRVRVVEASFYDVYLGDATVVYIYLYRSVIEKLVDKFERELRIGARIVSLDFSIPNWIPVRVRRLLDRRGIVRTLYLYIVGFSNPCSLKRRVCVFDYNRLLKNMGL